MKPLMRLLFLLTILLTLSLSVLLFSIFQPTLLVNRVADLTMDRMEDGKRILDANDPRRLRAGEVRQVSLTQEDLDLAVNYLANQYARGSASLALQLGRAKVELTMPAPRNHITPAVWLDKQPRHRQPPWQSLPVLPFHVASIHRRG